MLLHVHIDGRKEQIEKLDDFKVHVTIDMPELEVLRDMMKELRILINSIYIASDWVESPRLDTLENLQKKLEELVPRRKDEKQT